MKILSKNLSPQNLFFLILCLAFLLRLVAVFLAKGYVAHDDHFIPVETAYLWLSNQADFFSDKGGAWRNQLYTLIHYGLLFFLQKISIQEPQNQMLVIRFLHALYSLLGIIYGYLLAKKMSNEKTALFIALLLACFWPLPYVSVHSLVEAVCAPLIIMFFYYLFLADTERLKIFFIFAGLFFALAMTIRFQVFIMGVVVGISFILQKKFSNALWLFFSTFGFLCVFMGILDTISYGYPFASFIQYSFYNLQASAAVTQPWYFYLVFLLIIFIFPTSILFFIGFIKSAKKYPIYIISSFSFFFLHSIFSNKQERFIIPFVFLLLIFGSLNWGFNKKNPIWKKKLYKILWGWFWVINILFLFVSLPTSPKKTLIDALDYLAKRPDLQEAYILSPEERFYLPKFYFRNNAKVWINTSLDEDSKKEQILKDSKINYFLFLGEKPSKQETAKIEALLNKKIKNEKVFSYNTWQKFLWGKSYGNRELKNIFIYKVKAHNFSK